MIRGAIARKWKVLILAAACAVPFGIHAGSSEANIGRSFANNRHHRIKFQYVPSAKIKQAAWFTIKYDLRPTDLTVKVVNSGEDVRMIARYYNASWAGLTFCPLVYQRWSTCDRFTVKIDRKELKPQFYRQAVVCHELGHTVGLKHTSKSHPGYGKSCMQSDNVWKQRLSGHDRKHINKNY